MDDNSFNINNISEFRENNRLEVKKASNGLPYSIWETYSSFANSDGGLIVLGIEEDKNHQLHIVGVSNPEGLIRDFWNTINNPQKISLNILTDYMVQPRQIDGKTIITIDVPRAEREMRPIYVGTDPIKGTYRRNNEGDFHCTREQVSAMYRDASPVSIDTRVLTNMDSSVFCQDTINDYRIIFNAQHTNHTWSKMDDELFLRRVGAVGLSHEDNKIHPTVAGLLMFGYEYEIVREFSQYFLDYQEHMTPSIRWTHRVVSSSGEWSGNLFDFYYRIINRLTRDLSVPFRLEGTKRVDDTKLHEAVREALLNSLVHADYYGRQGLVVTKSPSALTFANPGDMRISLTAALEGGISDPRNATLMKMFALIGIGERAGSGIPSIISSFQEATHLLPDYKISYAPERVFCTINLNTEGITGKTTEKSVEKSVEKSAEKILKAINDNPLVTVKELVNIVGLTRRGIEKQIATLKMNGIIRRVGPDKGGHWEIIQ